MHNQKILVPHLWHERAQEDQGGRAAAPGHVVQSEGYVWLRRHPQLAVRAPEGVAVLKGERGIAGDDVQFVASEDVQRRVGARRRRHHAGLQAPSSSNSSSVNYRTSRRCHAVNHVHRHVADQQDTRPMSGGKGDV